MVLDEVHTAQAAPNTDDAVGDAKRRRKELECEIEIFSILEKVPKSRPAVRMRNCEDCDYKSNRNRR